MPGLSPVFEQAVRRRLGSLLEGAQGELLVEQADTWLSARGVQEPERYSAMLMPGAALLEG